MNFIIENWVILLPAVLGLAEVIVRLTPTTKDDSILEWIWKLVNLILPNNKKGGGKHK